MPYTTTLVDCTVEKVKRERSERPSFWTINPQRGKLRANLGQRAVADPEKILGAELFLAEVVEAYLYSRAKRARNRLFTHDETSKKFPQLRSRGKQNLHCTWIRAIHILASEASAKIFSGMMGLKLKLYLRQLGQYLGGRVKTFLVPPTSWGM